MPDFRTGRRADDFAGANCGGAMPRKRTAQAATLSRAFQFARWRYLLRNPDFHKDMDALNGTLQSSGFKFVEEREKIAEKWGMLRIPGEAIVYWPGGRPHPDDFASLEKYGSGDLVSFSPVAATELRKKRFLFLRVDMKYPLDQLLPLIEEELRLQNKSQHRYRLDKVDFHLKVFDLATEGLSFSQIAEKVHSNVSTVKSSYITATEKIFPDTSRPKKKHLPLENFDPDTHAPNCAICLKAERAEQMCPVARRYFDQDYVSQREPTGYDTTR